MVFLGWGNVQALAKYLSLREVSAVLVEFPSNPLLECHNLFALCALADRYGFMLVVDNTISNVANVDLLRTRITNVVCTSLTKLFSRI